MANGLETKGADPALTTPSGSIARFVEWFKCLDSRYKWEKERAARRVESRKRQEAAMVAPCPYCGSAMKEYRVLQRSARKGHVVSASKEWTCGTKTGLRMMHSEGVSRGVVCLSNNED